MKKGVVIVAVVLATVLLLGLGTAMARDAILFPYFKSGGGDVTFFQIINTAKVQTPGTGTSQGKLDYVYVYNSGTEVCTHYDDVGKVTQNDILLYEATGVYPGQLLPGDTTSTSPKLTVSPSWGYLVVKQNSSSFTTGLEGTLFGQAYVANINTGTVYAYNAVNDPSEADLYEFDENANFAFILSFLPETLATTQWYFFPVDGGVDLTTDALWNYDAEITGGSNAFDFGGVFDNNESLKSGVKEIMVGCWDDPLSANFFYTLAQITSGAQYNAVKGTGGFTSIFTNYAELYVKKIQNSTVLGKPMTTMVSEPGFYTHGNPGGPLANYSYTK